MHRVRVIRALTGFAALSSWDVAKTRSRFLIADVSRRARLIVRARIVRLTGTFRGFDRAARASGFDPTDPRYPAEVSVIPAARAFNLSVPIFFPGRLSRCARVIDNYYTASLDASSRRRGTITRFLPLVFFHRERHVRRRAETPFPMYFRIAQSYRIRPCALITTRRAREIRRHDSPRLRLGAPIRFRLPSPPFSLYFHATFTLPTTRFHAIFILLSFHLIPVHVQPTISSEHSLFSSFQM